MEPSTHSCMYCSPSTMESFWLMSAAISSEVLMRLPLISRKWVQPFSYTERIKSFSLFTLPTVVMAKLPQVRLHEKRLGIAV